mgnify:FL=1|tara:strand:+ start:223 stop:1329 length:1107 start_codon:yes stop_codon:yes gene_type:complete
MARNRVIYQSEALYVSEDASSSVASKHEQLEKVQSANLSYTINRQDINQFGELARIDSVIMDPPTVSTDFSYYLADGFNERALGFYVQTGSGGEGGVNSDAGQFASGHMISSSGKNVYLVTGPEGQDMVGRSIADSTDTAIGVGNCYVSDYTVDLAVGSIPTVSVSLEGANVRGDTTAGGIALPSVDQEDGSAVERSTTLDVPVTGRSDVNALRPGDITFSLGSFQDETLFDLTGVSGIHIQSASINIPLSRTPLQRLGSRFPYAREVDFPVNVTMNISALVNEADDFQLATQLTQAQNNASITIKNKAGNNAVIYTLKGAKVDSESVSSSIGSNKTVDITMSAQIGGTNDTSAGLFMSGKNGDEVFA